MLLHKIFKNTISTPMEGGEDKQSTKALKYQLCKESEIAGHAPGGVGENR